MHCYHAFGLNIHSDIPFVEFLPATATMDVEITSGRLPTHITENSQQILIRTPHATFFVEQGKSITYHKEVDTDEDTLRLFLVGSAMGALLQQRGHIVLHGNAISYDQQTCTVFVGNQGAGKSTTAAWHCQQGATILADDVSAIFFDTQGKPYVMPSYPQLKLWQSSIDLLNISSQDLRKLRQEYDKYALPITENFSSTPRPVTRIIEISDQKNEHLTTIKKLDMLMTHTYRYHFIQRMQRTPDYAKLLLRLAARVDILTDCRPVLSQIPQPILTFQQ